MGQSVNHVYTLEEKFKAVTGEKLPEGFELPAGIDKDKKVSELSAAEIHEVETLFDKVMASEEIVNAKIAEETADNKPLTEEQLSGAAPVGEKEASKEVESDGDAATETVSDADADPDASDDEKAEEEAEAKKGYKGKLRKGSRK